MESSLFRLLSWVFLSCPVCPLPPNPRTCVYCSIFLDLPWNARPNVIYTERQVEIAKRRMEKIGRQPPAKFTKKKVVGFFTTWHIWLLVPCDSSSHQFLSECPRLILCMSHSVHPRMSRTLWWRLNM